MNEDRGHGAMPKLYGAPAYARPPVLPVQPAQRPFDPDALPLEAERLGEDLPAMAQMEAAGLEEAGHVSQSGTEGAGKILGLPLRLRLPGRGRQENDSAVGE